MSTNRTVSFRSLRVLTYTVLFKAVIDVVMFVSRLADGTALLTIAQAAEFITIVSCVMCLSGVVALSGKFVSMRRFMVIVLILDCITLMLIMLEMRMIIGNYAAAAAGFELIALVSFTAEKLLAGAAFLFLMKGFGEILKEEGEEAAASASERLGRIYLCINSCGALMAVFAVIRESGMTVATAAVFEFAVIILEFLMYRRVYQASFLVWRNRAAVVSNERTFLQ